MPESYQNVIDAIREARSHATAVNASEYSEWELDSTINAIDAAIDAASVLFDE